MEVTTKKKMRVNLTKGQDRLLRESLKKLLGKGLLGSTQRGHHEIHPVYLRDALNSHFLNK